MRPTRPTTLIIAAALAARALQPASRPGAHRASPSAPGRGVRVAQPRLARLDAATLTRDVRVVLPQRPLLTAAEERVLGAASCRLVDIEEIRDAERARLGREPTRSEWAAAAGYDDDKDLKAARHRLGAARDELISRNRRLVLSVANRYRCAGLDFDDLVAEGTYGLAKAARRYDPARGCRFSTYAVWWIRQSIAHAVGHQGRTIRLPAHVHEKLRAMRRHREAVFEATGVEATDDDVAAALELDPKKVRRLRLAIAEVGSIDGFVTRGGSPKGSEAGGGGSVNAPRAADLLADPTQRPDADAEARLMRRTVARAIGGLDDRERAIVVARYGLEGAKPSTLQEIGTAHGITRERTRQIERHALLKLRVLATAADFLIPGESEDSRRARRRADAVKEREARRAPPCRCRDVRVGDRLREIAGGRACEVLEIKKGGWLVVRWEDGDDGPKFVRPSLFFSPRESDDDVPGRR
mmetsp:Transcript_31606/g.97706  ORF Transcript_31606/g.97706 Transcript_31606/m.97706 type:complete len:469 (+) Transcript_31606:164-1570(+)